MSPRPTPCNFQYYLTSILFLLLFISSCSIVIEPNPIPEPPTPDPPPIFEPIGYCGDGDCETTIEDFIECPEDCAPYCGDGWCSRSIGETMWSCWEDCQPEEYNDKSIDYTNNFCPVTPKNRIQVKYRKEFVTDPKPSKQ